MAIPVHTYGPTCRLSHSKPDPFALRSSPSPPRLNTQFFYLSPQSIDDLLSPIPPGGSTLETQPFFAKDNTRLEEAWLAIRQRRRRRGVSLDTEERRSVISEGSTTFVHHKREKCPVDLVPGSVKRRASPVPTVHDVGDTKLDGHASSSSPTGSFRQRDLPHYSPSRRSMGSDGDDGLRSSPQSLHSHQRRPSSSQLGASPTKEQTSESLLSELGDKQEIVPVGVSRLHQVELPNLKV